MVEIHPRRSGLVPPGPDRFDVRLLAPELHHHDLRPRRDVVVCIRRCEKIHALALDLDAHFAQPALAQGYGDTRHAPDGLGARGR